jgi:hypothetical protein
MADCTVADVLNDAMSLLGDPDGEITQEIANDFATSYTELMDAALLIAAPEIQREVYYTLPANTGVLFPVQLGVTDFAEPSQIYERGSVQSVNIVSITDGTPLTVVASGTPAPTDGRVEISGATGSSPLPGWVNRDWFITPTGPNTFTLNGSITTGIGGVIATTGTVNWSSDGFVKMNQVDVRPPEAPPTPQNLGVWRWADRFIYFPNGSNQPRQLWIEYLADETPPASGIIGLFNGRELKFLSHATAASFAPKRQLPMGPQLMAKAYGPSGQADMTGGLCRSLLNPVLKQKNALPRRAGLYRMRRGFVSIIT